MNSVDFDFVAFVDKYELSYSDELVGDIVRALGDAEAAYDFSIEVGRCPELEPVILGCPVYSYHYAKNIIGGRWPEAEPVILRCVDSSYFYARDVIKGRWPEAEPLILGSGWAIEYRLMYLVNSKVERILGKCS